MEQPDEREIDLRELFYLLLNKWLLILSSGLVLALVAFLITYFLITPKYTSNTTLMILNKTENGQLTSSDLSVSTSLTSDFEILVTSRTVLEAVIDDLKLNIGTGELEKKITVNNPTNTRMLKVSVEDTNADMAKAIADSVAEISSEQIVKLMGIEQVNIVDYGNTPAAPSSPGIIKNVVLGGAAGLFISIGLIFLKSIFDDTIKTSEDVEKYLEASVLGIIPKSDAKETDTKKAKR